MAELEASKHAKKALEVILKKNEKGIWHKIKDFLLEIFIIVFAVSLSIWFHSLSEKSHQREEVREFLTDLKTDLAADRKTIKSNRALLDSRIINISNSKSKNILMLYISRSISSGNYEGFKSSGNIAYIHNKILKNKILDYYEQEMKSLDHTEAMYTRQMEKIAELTVTDYDLSILKNTLTGNKNILIKQYNRIIEKNNDIVKEIDKELKQ